MRQLLHTKAVYPTPCEFYIKTESDLTTNILLWLRYLKKRSTHFPTKSISQIGIATFQRTVCMCAHTCKITVMRVHNLCSNPHMCNDGVHCMYNRLVSLAVSTQCEKLEVKRPTLYETQQLNVSSKALKINTNTTGLTSFQHPCPCAHLLHFVFLYTQPLLPRGRLSDFLIC